MNKTALTNAKRAPQNGRFRLLSGAALALACLSLFGCGGGGHSSHTTTSPFAGNWSGTYSSSGESGTASVVIAADGSYTGGGFDNTANENYTVQGAITTAGVVTGILTEGSLNASLNGTWSISNGHLGGAVTVSQDGVQGATNIYDMTQGAQTAQSGFRSGRLLIDPNP